jgi:4-oxalocrotonate tautomerase
VPFVDLRTLAGHLREIKKEIARRVTEAISEIAELFKEGVWVAFGVVAPLDWYVSGIPVK